MCQDEFTSQLEVPSLFYSFYFYDGAMKKHGFRETDNIFRSLMTVEKYTSLPQIEPRELSHRPNLTQRTVLWQWWWIIRSAVWGIVWTVKGQDKMEGRGLGVLETQCHYSAITIQMSFCPHPASLWMMGWMRVLPRIFTKHSVVLLKLID